MDFSVFAIAFNIGKLSNYKERAKKIAEKNTKNQLIVIFILLVGKKNVPYQKLTRHRTVTTLCAAA
jgi:hypothetical protein